MEIKTVGNVQCACNILAGCIAGRLQRDRRLRKVRRQAVKWTTEGAGNGTRSLVYCDVRRASDARDITVRFESIAFDVWHFAGTVINAHCASRT